MIADMLTVHGQTYVAVEADIDSVGEARRAGYPVLFGDVARAELVDRLNLPAARALILTMDDPVLTVRLARRIREAAPTCRSSRARATWPMRPNFTGRGSARRCPRRWKARCNCRRRCWSTWASRWGR